MTGLEKILEDIKKEADTESQKILKEAEAKASVIKQEAEKDAAETKKKGEEKLARDLQIVRERNESSSQLRRSQMTLKKKQELIGETVSKAKERVLSLPDDEYFKTILKVADRSLAAEEGIVYFNEKDLHRMTEDFKDQLLKLAEEKGGKLEISTERRKLDGGFVLQYGGIEENCSIDAIFATEYESLQDIVQKAIF